MKGKCLIWSRGRLPPPPPSLLCRGQGIGKQLGNLASWYDAPAVSRTYRCQLYFSLFFSHFVLNMPCERHSDYILETGWSPEDIVGKEVSFLSLVSGYEKGEFFSF